MEVFGQNKSICYNGYGVTTTKTRVFVYKGKNFVGSAGVKNPKDFDFESLFKIAIHETGSSLEL